MEKTKKMEKRRRRKKWWKHRMNVNKNKIVKRKQFYRRKKKEFSSEKRRNPSTKPNGIKILWFAYNLICNCVQMHCKLWTRMSYASNVWHIKFSTQSLSIYFPNTRWNGAKRSRSTQYFLYCWSKSMYLLRMHFTCITHNKHCELGSFMCHIPIDIKSLSFSLSISTFSRQKVSVATEMRMHFFRFERIHSHLQSIWNV